MLKRLKQSRHTKEGKRSTKSTPNKKMVIGTYRSIITLNVNGLNAPAKRHRLAEGIQKQDPYTCCVQETHFRPKDTYRLKVRGWKNIFHANGKQKKAGIAILISDKIDLKINGLNAPAKRHRLIEWIQKQDPYIYCPVVGWRCLVGCRLGGCTESDTTEVTQQQQWVY